MFCSLLATYVVGKGEHHKQLHQPSIVTKTCNITWGEIDWYINGKVVNEGSFEEGLFNDTKIEIFCSFVTKGSKKCDRCGCDNCLPVNEQQKLSSTLTVWVYNSLNISCLSRQKYTGNKEFHIIRDKFEYSMSKSKLALIFII